MSIARVVLTLGVICGATALVVGQRRDASKLTAQLQQLFPDAGSFSSRTGSPPHFEAYEAASAANRIVGLAFWTTDLDPLERGYDGPIKILVGLDMTGAIAGVIVADHHEPYGYFSVDLPAFAAQFKGKSVRDPFRVGGDVDAVSRASITIASAARAIRDSSRMVAKALLPAEVTK